MIKILFLINSLGGGGAERVLVNLVNHMDHEKYDITVETVFGGGVNRNQLDESIHYVEHGVVDFKGISYLLRFIPSSLLSRLFIRDLNYDLFVAYIQGPATKILSGKKNCRKIAWLHSSNIKDYIGKCWFTKRLTVNAYKRFNMICGVSRSVIENFSTYANIDVQRTVVYNTNDTEFIQKKSKELYEFKVDNNRLKICSVGRLATQKGFDRLIYSAKRLFDEGYEFDLFILGQGQKQNELEKQISDVDASDYIHLMGFCSNPYSIMARCDIFICSSRWEGLSTVLTEALILGLPIVSTDVSGAKEVLGENNEYGLVVENSDEGVYFGLKTFMKDPMIREEYRIKSHERAKLYETRSTVEYVEKLFDSIIIGKK